MGLGGMKYAWQRQTKDFGHIKGGQYSSLVTDNRGIGDSEDAVRLLDALGIDKVHVVGASMGGMIAQEIVSPFISSSSSAQSTGGVIVFGSDAIPSVFAHKFSQVLSTRASNISHTQHHPVISTVH